MVRYAGGSTSFRCTACLQARDLRVCVFYGHARLGKRPHGAGAARDDRPPEARRKLSAASGWSLAWSSSTTERGERASKVNEAPDENDLSQGRSLFPLAAIKRRRKCRVGRNMAIVPGGHATAGSYPGGSGP